MALQAERISIVPGGQVWALNIEGTSEPHQLYTTLEAAISAGWDRARRDNIKLHIQPLAAGERLRAEDTNPSDYVGSGHGRATAGAGAGRAAAHAPVRAEDDPRLPEAVSRSNNHGYRILARPGEPALHVRGSGDATSWFPEFHARIGGASRGCVIQNR